MYCSMYILSVILMCSFCCSSSRRQTLFTLVTGVRRVLFRSTDFNADLYADLMRRIDVRHDSACGKIPYQAEFLALATRDFRHPADGDNPSFGLPVLVFRSCSSDSRSVIDRCVMDH